MHALLPLASFLLSTSPLVTQAVEPPAVQAGNPVGDAAEVTAVPATRETAANTEKREPKVFTLPLRVPEAQLMALLRKELDKKKLLKDFQVTTSKFSHGRVVLDSLDVLHGPRVGTVRLEAHARLRFDRKQLGIKWRGLKSHKKWFQKGAKDAADVRVTCVATLGQLAGSDDELGARLTNIRVKMVSRLRPARGLTARFDVSDKEFGWTPEGGLFDHLRIASLRIAGVERDALRLEVEVSKVPR